MFSLVLALISSPAGLKRHEILSTVYGYEHRYRVEGEQQALERQFERDKAQLRELGIPLESLEPDEDLGNTRETRYRIRESELSFPAALSFDERELSLLRLASLAWREGSLTSEARRASMKVAALGAGFDAGLLGVAPDLGATEPSAPTLQGAIEHERIVTFRYQHPEYPEPLARHVAPLQLHRFEGRWHLFGWDLDRNAARVFLLSRIVGPASERRTEIAPPVRADRERICTELRQRLQQLLEDSKVRVVVRASSPAHARLVPRARSMSPMPDDESHLRIEFGATDLYELAVELFEFGSDLSVESPKLLRELVRERFENVLHAHRSEGEDSYADAMQTGAQP